jgi:VWFA-related protein
MKTGFSPEAQLPAVYRSISRSLCVCSCVCASLALPLNAQRNLVSGPSAPGPDLPAQVQANPDEVLIDLVVRDKKNKPVTNLSTADLAVSDGGKPVKLDDLHLVTPQSGAAMTIALVFDRISAESAKTARNLAMRLVAVAPQRSAIAVLGVDRGLRLLANFTEDRGALVSAVDTALADIPQHQLADAEKQLMSVVQTGLTASGQHASVSERATAQMVMSALEQSQKIAQEQHAPATLAGLLALSKAQQGAGGRKIIVFFSEGLRSDSSTESLTKEVVETANRAGLCIYTVDTNAVDAKGFDMLTMMYQPSGGLPVRASPGVSGITTAPNMGRIETMQSTTEDAKSIGSLDRDRSDAKGNSLEFLAKGTGGFSIHGDEKSKEQLQRLMGEIGTYYEASYTPVLKEYDGQFHSLEIAPVRAGLTIRSRAGYFALAPDAKGAMAVHPFETPMLKILGNGALPAEVLFRQSVLNMGAKSSQTLNELAIEVPMAQVNLHEDPNTRLYAGHVSILAQVKDSSGVVVERFSEDEVRKGALESIASARGDVIALQRHFAAAPGNYVVEAVVLDRNGGKSGALRTEFTVPHPTEGPWLSDVAMVRRMQPFAHGPDPLEPLQYDGKRVVPNLAHEISAGTPKISFLFRMRGNPILQGGDGKLEVNVEREGKSVSHSSIAVSHAAGSEEHLNLATIDAGSLNAGPYRAVFTYAQGEKSCRRTFDFTVIGSNGEREEPEADAAEDAGEPVGTDADLESGLGHYVSLSGPGTLRLRDELLSGARERALGYLDTLMNFKCIELTDRYLDRKGTGTWTKHDKVAELVTYENHEETRNVLEVNGDPGNTKPADLKGGRLDGEFGGVQEIVFGPSSKAQFQWKERGKLDDNPVEVFTYRVEAKNSKFSVTALPETPIFVAYQGLVYIDAATRGVRRITIEAVGIPENSPVHASAITIDYDYIGINDHDYLMPVRGEMRMQIGKREKILHRIEFRDYHRFGSQVRIVGVEQK